MTYEFPDGGPCREGGDVQQRAYDIFRTLRATHFARIDFILDLAGTLWALEINTVPGVSLEGNFAVAAKRIGWSYDDLMISLLRTALARWPTPEATTTDGQRNRCAVPLIETREPRWRPGA